MQTGYDVLLINPPSTAMETFEHLGLGYLAACLRKHKIRVKILNLPQYTVKSALAEAKNYPVKLIGISVPFQEAAMYAFDLTTALKSDKPDTHICIGGIYPTFSYEEILRTVPSIDSLVLGEGEETFTELAQAVLAGRDWRDIKGIAYREDNKVIVTEARPLIENLDTLPYPERDVLPEVLKKTDFAPLQSSRGCYGRCTFCSVVSFFSQFGPKYRLRSSQNVMGEIDYLYNHYNVRNIEFTDANFIGGKGIGHKRAVEIGEEIINRNMDLRFSIQCRPDDVDKELFGLLKRAGLSKVFLGVESGTQTMLDRFRKDISVEENIKALQTLGELDIFVAMGFITFDEQITFEELGENLAFLRKARSIIPGNKLIFNPISKIIPLAGTEVEKHLIETNKLRGNSMRNSYSLDNPAMDLIYNTMSSLLKMSLTLRRGLNIGYSNHRMKRD